MSELRFYGASDDLIEAEGVLREEWMAGRDDAMTFRVWHDDGSGEIVGCLVTMRYTRTGTWSAEVGQLEEGFPIVWPIRIESEHEYSVALVLDVPDDVIVEEVQDG